ncbi:MAG: M48 family metallopeptidase [Candidatus Altimarinota bacterium]
MDYKITYSNAKHGWVRLLPDMTLKLTIPYKKSQDKSFETILLEKGKMLIEKYKKRNVNKIETITKDYVLIFGEKVDLREISGDLESFLKQKLYYISLPILDKYSGDLGILYNKFYVKNLKTKWGSCSSIQNISLNFKLVHLPLKFLRYVIIHEVCHLKEKNHGKKFWELVGKYCEDYKEIRKELKGMGV